MRFSKTPFEKMMRTTTTMKLALQGLSLLALLPVGVLAQSPCERFPQGSTIQEPENLYSTNGVLEVNFTYQTVEDSYGVALYCFMNSDGAQSPTLHVKPGDKLIINLTNLVPEGSGKMPAMPAMEMSKAGAGGCGAANMTDASVNMHFHGTNTPPICHQDEVIRTIVNSGETFRYEVHFPKNEPPGLYWYHPHIHGISTTAVQGGATGAIIVEGIENVNPAVAGLAQRVIVVRDTLPRNPGHVLRHPTRHTAGLQPAEAGWDLLVNYVPIGGPAYIPAVLEMKPGEKQFWRVANTSAITILDLRLLYDGKRQPLEVIGLDGVPIGSQVGTGQGKSITRTNLLIPPAGRAEFIVTGPTSDVKKALLLTENVDTGPGGDTDPTRPIFTINTSELGAKSSDFTRVPAVSGPPPPKRFAGLAEAQPTAARKLFFSEDENYLYITVDGETPKPYSMDDPPSIVTTQGSVEDWTIENRSPEVHEFHIHQIHFLLMAKDGTAVGRQAQQFLDTVNVPYWTGTGPYPSVTLRMDFRGPDIGDFVYHCHILDHEDGGMMAIIRVQPRTQGAATTTSK
jgi:FtsP/CotA-like multicopper oxidase with cupredoxin domain